MSDSYSVVQSYYDGDAEREWTRLIRHPFEFPVTMHYIRKYLRPRSSVLDVGAGPGRYSIELTRLGHSVDLLDLSPRCVSMAREKAKENNVELHSCAVGNCTDLSRFEDGTFDAVLAMGPLIHIVEETDRIAAISECLRVVKKAGLLVVSFVSSYASVYDIMNKGAEKIAGYRQHLEKAGSSRAFTASRDGVFTDSYYIEPFEIEPFMRRFALAPLTLIGAQGLVAQSQNAICRAGEGILQEWIELSIALAETRGALASSIHVVYFGRKE